MLGVGEKVISATITGLTTEYYYSNRDVNLNVKDIVEFKNQVASPATVREKTDPNANEPNFVNVFRDKQFYKNAQNIYSAPKWLFNMVESNSSTADLLDLTKYFLYKATEQEYDSVDEFDYEIFKLSNYTGNQNSTKKSNVAGVQGKIYDFLLGMGASEYGAAAVLGNLEAQVNLGEITWNKAYTEIDDIWKDIEKSKPELKYVLMNAQGIMDLNYATWSYAKYQGNLIDNDFNLSKDKVNEQYIGARDWYIEWKDNNPNLTRGDVEDILLYCDVVADIMIKENVSYNKETGLEYEDIAKNSDYTKMKVQDCGGYVSSVLYLSGAVTEEKFQQIIKKGLGFHNPNTLAAALMQECGWEKVNGVANLKKGDIISNGDHIGFYAGDGEFWDVYSGTGGMGYDGKPCDDLYRLAQGQLTIIRQPEK